MRWKDGSRFGLRICCVQQEQSESCRGGPTPSLSLSLCDSMEAERTELDRDLFCGPLAVSKKKEERFVFYGVHYILKETSIFIQLKTIRSLSSYLINNYHNIYSAYQQKTTDTKQSL
jgi:hypothetical protein